MQVVVRDNNIEQAIRTLRRKIVKDGFMTELKDRGLSKPSERRRGKTDRARWRLKKAAETNQLTCNPENEV
jgi:small subunit ribosomal protein S21